MSGSGSALGCRWPGWKERGAAWHGPGWWHRGPQLGAELGPCVGESPGKQSEPVSSLGPCLRVLLSSFPFLRRPLTLCALQLQLWTRRSGRRLCRQDPGAVPSRARGMPLPQELGPSDPRPCAVPWPWRVRHALGSEPALTPCVGDTAFAAWFKPGLSLASSGRSTRQG